MVDLTKISTVTPDAALVLAAELYRWKKTKNIRLRTVDIHKWSPKIRHLLGGLGFFRLLQASYPRHLRAKDKAQLIDDSHYVEYRTEKRTLGIVADKLYNEDLADFLGEVPDKRRLYAALAEAMNNVVKHAYDDPKYELPNWWLSAAYDNNSREISILIFDQGVGIPNTLPRNFSDSVQSVRLSMKGEVSDAILIQAAHEIHRTSTRASNRGHGMQRDIRRYGLNTDFEGSYSVTSRRGRYQEIRTNQNANVIMRSYASDLQGTLIEWRLKLV